MVRKKLLSCQTLQLIAECALFPSKILRRQAQHHHSILVKAICSSGHVWSRWLNPHRCTPIVTFVVHDRLFTWWKSIWVYSWISYIGLSNLIGPSLKAPWVIRIRYSKFRFEFSASSLFLEIKIFFLLRRRYYRCLMVQNRSKCISLKRHGNSCNLWLMLFDWSWLLQRLNPIWV